MPRHALPFERVFININPRRIYQGNRQPVQSGDTVDSIGRLLACVAVRACV